MTEDRVAIFKRALLGTNILRECGKICITLSKFSFADEDGEDDSPELAELKNLIARARDVVANMDEVGMLKKKEGTLH